MIIRKTFVNKLVQKSGFKLICRTAFFVLILAKSQVIECKADSKALIAKGWAELIKDNDARAFEHFNNAYEQAQIENSLQYQAEALLNMGICTYSVSVSEGLSYALKSMTVYEQMEETQPQLALQGRCKCLQLISTIKSRQGNYAEAIALSKEAMVVFPAANDTTGYLGLIYFSLGKSYGELHKTDSSNYFYRQALKEHLAVYNTTYLPTSILSVADIELKKGNKTESLNLYKKAMFLADSTGNRQAKVSSLLGLGLWTLTFENNNHQAENYFLEALVMANDLSDNTFKIKVLQSLIDLKKQQGQYEKALEFESQKGLIKEQINAYDRRKALENLEVKFKISEKDRQLALVQKEKDVAYLTNYLLGVCLAALLIIGFAVIVFLRRINNRNKMLLITKEQLVIAVEKQKELKEQQYITELQVVAEQKKLKEAQLQNEIEFKESQLSALTLQMLQKNELLLELKQQLETDNSLTKDVGLNKIINKGLNHDKEWSDFNQHFESVNKNFYNRLKQAYPDISPNDLRICALIKLNLSIKEMAGILNISPDSVKTARYRLRKKLQLNTEDNLTDFILKLN